MQLRNKVILFICDATDTIPERKLSGRSVGAEEFVSVASQIQTTSLFRNYLKISKTKGEGTNFLYDIKIVLPSPFVTYTAY